MFEAVKYNSHQLFQYCFILENYLRFTFYASYIMVLINPNIMYARINLKEEDIKENLMHKTLTILLFNNYNINFMLVFSLDIRKGPTQTLRYLSVAKLVHDRSNNFRLLLYYY